MLRDDLLKAGSDANKYSGKIIRVGRIRSVRCAYFMFREALSGKVTVEQRPEDMISRGHW